MHPGIKTLYIYTTHKHTHINYYYIIYTIYQRILYQVHILEHVLLITTFYLTNVSQDKYIPRGISFSLCIYNVVTLNDNYN